MPNREALELPDGSLPLHREMMAGAGAGLCQVSVCMYACVPYFCVSRCV